jgi:hypothetical protein
MVLVEILTLDTFLTPQTAAHRDVPGTAFEGLLWLHDGVEFTPTSGLFGIDIIKRDMEDDSSWSGV